MRQVAVTDTEAVRLALFFHDAVYDPRSTRTRPTVRRWRAASCPSSRSLAPRHPSDLVLATRHQAPTPATIDPAPKPPIAGRPRASAPTTQRSSSTRTSPSWPPNRRATRPAPRASGPSTHTSTTRPGAPDGRACSAPSSSASCHLPHRTHATSGAPGPRQPGRGVVEPRRTLISVRLRRAGAPSCGRRRGRTLRRRCDRRRHDTVGGHLGGVDEHRVRREWTGAGAGGSQGGGGELPPPGQRAALERWEHEHRLVQVPTRYHLRHLPAQARVSRWRRRLHARRASAWPPAPATCRPTGVRVRAQRGQGLTRPAHRDDGSVGGELPGDRLLERVPPGTRTARRRAAARRRWWPAAPCRPRTSAGTAPAAGGRRREAGASARPSAGDAEQDAADDGHDQAADGEGHTHAARRQAEQVRPAELRQRRLQQEVADALERARRRRGRPGR